MKNYIERLTDEELEYFCSKIIGPEKIRESFKKNPKGFNVLKPGFRATSLKNDEVISLIVSKRDKKLSGNIVNLYAESCLKMINDILKDSSDEEPVALAHTFSSTDTFLERPDIYFKLTDQQYDETVKERTFFYCGVMTDKQENRLNNSKEIKKAETENDQLKAEYDKCKSVNEQLEKEIKKLKTDNETLFSENTTLNKEKDKLKKTISEKQAALETYQKPDLKESNYRYTSLFNVVQYNDRLELNRLFDVENNHLIPIEGNEKYPHKYYILLKENEKYPIGKIGIWHWDIEPNKFNPEKDHFSKKESQNLKPIQAIILDQCNDISHVITELKSGIKVENKQDNIYVCYYDGSDKMNGVLCDNNKLNDSDGIVKLKREVLSLPVYSLRSFNILNAKVENEILYFVDTLDLGKADGYVSTRNECEVVKNLFLKRLTRKNLNNTDYAVTDLASCQEYIQKMPTEDMKQEVMDKLKCNGDVAEKYIHNFLERFDEYVSPEEITSKMLWTAINSHPDWKKQCEQKVEDDWNRKYQSRKDKAEGELKRLEQSVSLKKSELEEITKANDEQRKLAEEVEKEVQERINHASGNAAKFIAEMAFLPKNSVTAEVKVPDKIADDRKPNYTAGLKLDSSHLDEPCENEDDILIQLEEEFKYHGIKDNIAKFFSSYMYTLHLFRFPVLIAGPYARELADILSCKLYGRTAARVRLDGEYSENKVQQLKKIDSSVIVIENPFAVGWYPYYFDLLEQNEQQIIAVTPFAEELQCESGELADYMIPVFTGHIARIKESKDIYGSNVPKSLMDSVLKGDLMNNGLSGGKRLKMLKKGRISSLAEMKLSMVMNKMSFIDGTVQNVENNEQYMDAAFLTAVYPVLRLQHSTDEILRIADDCESSGIITDEAVQTVKRALGAYDE